MMKPNHRDAARVWQRVMAPEPAEPQSLQLLAIRLGMDVAFFRQLSKGKDDRLLGTLINDYAGQLRCLKGVLLLSGGNPPRNPQGHTQDHSLPRCFDHALQRLSAYQLRSSDPIYGPVFRELAKQTEYHCRCISELLGDSGNPFGAGNNR